MIWGLRGGENNLKPPMDLPKHVWQVLSSRGFRSKDEIEKILKPSLKDLSHPLELDDMDLAVERLLVAFKKKQKIAIYGDYDLDGTPGVALFYEGLKELGFETPLYTQPRRLKDGYGVHKHKIDELKRQGAELILTVDVGITDHVAIDYAKSLGIDVIITDHHLPKESLPDAVAIINPNKGHCGSGLTYLSGTGVAFYLVLALRQKMSQAGLLQNDFNPKDLLDLFALATITDMVPLIKENRTLVKYGLLALQKTKRPGLRRLLAELGLLGKNLTSTDISFKVAPKLNALSRLDEEILPIEILLANDQSAPRVVEEALLINQRRNEYQKKAMQIVFDNVGNKINEPYLLYVSDKFHPGIISVVANQLIEHFGVPVFLGAALDNGHIIGSARSPDNRFHLPTVLDAAKEDLIKYGGHALAAGFELSREKETRLREKLNQYFSETNLNANATDNHFYDADVELSELNEGFMKWHETLEPFGMGFETPVYRLKGVVVGQVKKMKRGHLKYRFNDPNSRIAIQGPWFTPNTEYAPGQSVDVYFEPQWNEFQGVKSLEIMVRDIIPC